MKNDGGVNDDNNERDKKGIAALMEAAIISVMIIMIKITA